MKIKEMDLKKELEHYRIPAIGAGTGGEGSIRQTAGAGKGDYLSPVLSGQENKGHCKNTEPEVINNKISFEKGTGITAGIFAK